MRKFLFPHRKEIENQGRVRNGPACVVCFSRKAMGYKIKALAESHWSDSTIRYAIRSL